MTVWTAKDPDSVADYEFIIPLDPDDTVATHTLEKLSGTVAIDSESIAENRVTAWLSGGEDGETSVFRVSWTTTGGRTFDEIITLQVASNDNAMVTGLQTRYPEFSAVAPAVIAYWLTDAARIVTPSWSAGDIEPATFALAAHNMAVANVPGIALDGTAKMLSAVPGVTRFRSASMDVYLTDAAANRSVAGGFGATRYGQEFAIMLRRNRGGPMLAGGAGWPCTAHGWAGPFPPC